MDLEFVLMKGAEFANLRAEREPATAGLMGNGHSKEHCRLKWPKINNSQTAALYQTVLTLENLLANEHNETQRTHLQQQLTRLHQQLPKKIKGLRLDVRLQNNRNDEKWFDVSGVHGTAKSYIRDQFAFYEKEVLEEWNRRTLGQPQIDPNDLPPSPLIEAAQTTKIQRYSPLIRTAQIQHANGDRISPPDFFACIFSHEGEFSPDAIRSIEWVAMQRFSRFTQEGKRRDGLTPSQASAQVRAKLRDGFATAIAKGWGHQLRAGGFPRRVDDDRTFLIADGFY
jgi:hypothetical protein